MPVPQLCPKINFCPTFTPEPMRTQVISGLPVIVGSSGGSSGGSEGWLKSALDVVKSVGPLVAHWFSGLFGGGPSRWDSAGPGVHDWFHYYGPQAFQDWLDANSPGSYASMDLVRTQLVAWLAGSPWGWTPKILCPDGYGLSYSGVDIAARWYAPIIPSIYAQMGIDYQATCDAVHAAKENDLMKYGVMLKGGPMDVAANTAGQNAVDAVNQGNATDAQNDLVDQLLALGFAYLDAKGILHFSPDGKPSGGSSGGGGGVDVSRKPPEQTASVPWLLLAAGAGALYFANKTKK